MKRSRIRARAGKAAPVVFAVLSLVGLAASVVSTARKAPEVKERLDEAEEEKGEELTMVEKIKHVAPACVEPAIFVVATGVVIILGSRAHFKAVEFGTAASGAAYLWHSRFKKMGKSVKEQCGSAAYEAVKKDVAAKEEKEVEVVAAMNKSDVQRVKEWYFDDNKDGHFLVWEPISEQTISISKATLMAASLRLNRMLIKDGEEELNDFICALGGHCSERVKGMKWSIMSESQSDQWDWNGTGPWVDPYIDILHYNDREILAIFYDVAPEMDEDESSVA